MPLDVSYVLLSRFVTLSHEERWCMDLNHSCLGDLNIHKCLFKGISTEDQLLCYHAGVKCAAATCDCDHMSIRWYCPILTDSVTNPTQMSIRDTTAIPPRSFWLFLKAASQKKVWAPLHLGVFTQSIGSVSSIPASVLLSIRSGRKLPTLLQKTAKEKVGKSVICINLFLQGSSDQLLGLTFPLNRTNCSLSS